MLIESAARTKANHRGALPQFVVEDHPLFVKFLDAYFEWSSTQHSDAAMSSMKYNMDIDTSLDLFVDYFHSTYFNDFPRVVATDRRLLFKHLKNLYENKGTDKSFELFFRAMFGDDVETYYPRDEVFDPSSGDWRKSSYLRATSSETEARIFSQKNLQIRGQTSGATAWVDEILIYRSGDIRVIEYKLFDVAGTFSNNESIVCDAPAGQLISQIYTVFGNHSFDSGSGWNVGDPITIPSAAESALAKVAAIELGEVVDFDIVDGGTGYSVGDDIAVVSHGRGGGASGSVSSVGGSGEILSISLNSKGFGYDDYSPSVVIDSESGSGATINVVYDGNFGKIKAIEYVNVGLFPRSLNIIEYNHPNASFLFYPKANYTLSHYANEDGFPSNKDKLHDSDYYQQYSYVLKTYEAINLYEQAFKKLLHPAGMKMFGEVLNQTVVRLNVHAISVPELEFNVFTIDPVFAAEAFIDVLTEDMFLQITPITKTSGVPVYRYDALKMNYEFDMEEIADLEMSSLMDESGYKDDSLDLEVYNLGGFRQDYFLADGTDKMLYDVDYNRNELNIWVDDVQLEYGVDWQQGLTIAGGRTKEILFLGTPPALNSTIRIVYVRDRRLRGERPFQGPGVLNHNLREIRLDPMLYDDAQFDEDGNPLTATYFTYPTTTDQIARIESAYVNTWFDQNARQEVLQYADWLDFATVTFGGDYDYEADKFIGKSGYADPILVDGEFQYLPDMSHIGVVPRRDNKYLGIETNIVAGDDVVVIGDDIVTQEFDPSPVIRKINPNRLNKLKMAFGAEIILE